jgi:hypothetical protein
VAGDLCVRNSTGYSPATDGQQAEAYCIVGAGVGVLGTFTTEEGLVATFTGTLAAGAVAYVAGAQAVDGGSQGNKNCGHSLGLVEWDSTKCKVKLHFKDAETTTHA